MTMVHAALLSTSLFLFGCSHLDSKRPVFSDEGPLTQRYRSHQKQIQAQEMQKIGRLIGVERTALRARNFKQFPLPEIVTDENLYTEILQSYRSRDIDRLEFFSAELQQRFPRSVFADNAVYLAGHLKLSLGLPTMALRDFENVLKNYPVGSKRAAALLGKGTAYRKLKLYKFAEKVFGELRKEYPGSPEFFKAELEEKLLRAEREAS